MAIYLFGRFLGKAWQAMAGAVLEAFYQCYPQGGPQQIGLKAEYLFTYSVELLILATFQLQCSGGRLFRVFSGELTA